MSEPLSTTTAPFKRKTKATRQPTATEEPSKHRRMSSLSQNSTNDDPVFQGRPQDPLNAANSDQKQAISNFTTSQIVSYPAPGFAIPSSLQFSPDDSVISYLFSPERNLNRQLFYFDLKTKKHDVLVAPPSESGVKEENITNFEKLRRERLRERGLGVTRYEWSTTTENYKLLVPLPNGVNRFVSSHSLISHKVLHCFPLGFPPNFPSFSLHFLLIYPSLSPSLSSKFPSWNPLNEALKAHSFSPIYP